MRLEVTLHSIINVVVGMMTIFLNVVFLYINLLGKEWGYFRYYYPEVAVYALFNLVLIYVGYIILRQVFDYYFLRERRRLLKTVRNLEEKISIKHLENELKELG